MLGRLPVEEGGSSVCFFLPSICRRLPAWWSPRQCRNTQTELRCCATAVRDPSCDDTLYGEILIIKGRVLRRMNHNNGMRLSVLLARVLRTWMTSWHPCPLRARSSWSRLMGYEIWEAGASSVTGIDARGMDRATLACSLAGEFQRWRHHPSGPAPTRIDST